MLTQLQIRSIQQIRGPAIIAVSGYGGSGKSTLAKEIEGLTGAQVVAVDSFIIDKNMTYYECWGLVDYIRLEREVLKPFVERQSDISYGVYDWSKDAVDSKVKIEKDILVVEGIGLLRTELLEYFDYKIWVDTSLEESIRRGKKRDREEYNEPHDELWDGLWRDNELECVEKYNPRDVADMIVVND